MNIHFFYSSTLISYNAKIGSNLRLKVTIKRKFIPLLLISPKLIFQFLMRIMMYYSRLNALSKHYKLVLLF